jgi:hypothetical protein
MTNINGNNNQTPPANKNGGNAGNPPANPNGNGDTGKAQSFTYRCAENCTCGGKFYREDDIMVLPEQKEVPHFKLAEKAGE